MEELLQLGKEMKEDLCNGSIFPFWIKYTVDEENGGFYGSVSIDKVIDKTAEKSLVLNARILWTFSSAYRLFKDTTYKMLADRAFQYIVDHFWDEKRGGGYWMLHPDGSVASDIKMTYAQGFLLYGFSEYVRATGSEEGRRYANLVYDFLEKECKEGNYYRECARGSEDNGSIVKEGTSMSMNTHLHILEPMTCYYRIRHDACVEESLVNLIQVVCRKVYDVKHHHFTMFFDENMNPVPGEISFGHDIEGSWLITEAAEVLQEYGKDQERAKALLEEAKEVSIHMVNYTLEHGMDTDGALVDEGYENGGFAVTDKVWWVEAEAVVGCVNAYQITGDTKYIQKAWKVWNYIKNEIINGSAGEWLTCGRNSTKDQNYGELCGAWKCPYHNSRAAMEIYERIEKMSF